MTMGSPFACVLANLFMSYKENGFECPNRQDGPEHFLSIY